jgi:hypothetical protein
VALRGEFSFHEVVKEITIEKHCQSYLTDPTLLSFLLEVDADLAVTTRTRGCVHCPGVLHSACYKRKPRLGSEKAAEVMRRSFCCDQDGCRRRHTSPSVLFLGRKVYAGFIVVLLSAMAHGLIPPRVAILREMIGADRRTLSRWREFWLKTFALSPFWKARQGRFSPALNSKTLAWSLCSAFYWIDSRDRLLDLLRFLAPWSASQALKLAEA